ncbi:SRR1-like protein isoform X1 [Frieseomelitta varia]|uniref:SRR1-like protein isoform X1 n=1 Tax=Frieseomelitta varia TaxID=561572 RepID=UPI001CB689E7|nr:SRR1-like protein isoform X1 [Frieseomelitta varia]XP_043519666.1 SRR1-like protein isoform X1 [Frieseomelitta varia]
MRDSEEFKFVTRRKKRISHVRNIRHTSTFLTTNDIDDGSLNINYETLTGKLLEAETEVRNSSFADNVFYYLKDSLTSLNSSDISDILCYGLGHFSSHRSSKYQLALLLSLKKHYNSQIHIYDPVFSSEEIKFLKWLDFNVITINEEGKHVIRNNITLVYMPHCSIHLINNFLYANWCKNLNKCILLTNSFSVVTDSLKKTNRFSPIDYIIRIQPYVTEITLRNNFIYKEVFNDLSIHTFFEHDINKIPENFWNIREKPCYQHAEIDYLTAKETEEIDAKNCNKQDET